MPTNILMPALSPTMEKGNLARWLKKEGDKIKSGDVIAEIETDKATMEYEAIDDGTLAKIVVPEGTQDVAVNSVIAVLARDGEDVKRCGGRQRFRPLRKLPEKKVEAQAASPQSSPQRGQRTRSAGSQAQTPFTSPQEGRRSPAEGSEGRARDCRPLRNRDLLVATRAASCKGGGYRFQSCAGFGSAWPRDCPRYRGRKIRKGLAWTGRSAASGGRCTINCSFDVGPADPLSIRRRHL